MDTPSQYGEKCRYMTLKAGWDLMAVDTDPPTKGWLCVGQKKELELVTGVCGILICL